MELKVVYTVEFEMKVAYTIGLEKISKFQRYKTSFRAFNYLYKQDNYLGPICPAWSGLLHAANSPVV